MFFFLMASIAYLELVQCLAVVAKIELGADQYDWCVRTMMRHFWIPLGANVLERRWIHEREANEEDVRLRIRQRS